MSIFKKYSSIENHYQQKFIDKVKLTPGADETDWIACEKVHGANFSFIVNRSQDKREPLTVHVAKRTTIIGDDDPFYPEATREVKNKYSSVALKAFEILDQEYVSRGAHVYRVTIFGELFGGRYSSNSTFRVPIQKGVYYSDEFEFYAFDTHVLYKGSSSLSTSSEEQQPRNSPDDDKGSDYSGGGTWLSFDEASQLFIKAGFHIHAKELARGSLSNILNFDTEFNTRIPEMFFPHLPPMELGTNICEGIIIRPARKTLYLRTGDRILIKKKNTLFSEVNKPSKPKTRSSYDLSKWLESEEAEKAWEDIQRFITVQRLHSCESKHGQLSLKTKGKLAGMLAKDVIEDFVKENDVLWQSVKKEDKRRITRKISSCCIELVTTQLPTTEGL